jgi:hypothetical protein
MWDGVRSHDLSGRRQQGYCRCWASLNLITMLAPSRDTSAYSEFEYRPEYKLCWQCFRDFAQSFDVNAAIVPKTGH